MWSNKTTYEVKENTTLNFTLQFLGNPKPNVTAHFGDKQLPMHSAVPVNGKKHAFEYKLARLNSTEIADCGKILSFEAVNKFGNLSKEVRLLVDCKYIIYILIILSLY